MAETTANLLQEILEQQSETLAVEEKVEDYLKRQKAKDQSRIAWVIIWAFVFGVGGIFLLVLGIIFLSGECNQAQNCNRWEEPANFLLTVVSSVLLPVVTLVLGYYFGKEKVS